jgi:ribosomal protein S11
MKVTLTKTKNNVMCTLSNDGKLFYYRSFGSLYKKQTISGGLNEYFRVVGNELSQIGLDKTVSLITRGVSSEDILELSRVFNKVGVTLLTVIDSTPVAFNGCANKKTRRV